MRATFFDHEAQARLERDGFAVIPFLEQDEIDRLQAAYERLGRAPGDPEKACISTFHTWDASYKVATHEAINRVLEPHLKATFDRQRALPSNFLVKWPGGMSGFGLHQDLSLTDERYHRSVEVWVALEDTTPQNGQLWFVPGSHDWIPTLRGIQMFPFPFWPVAQRIVQNHAVPVPIKAGQAIVFNHAVLHFSQPNRTDAYRLVAISDLIPEEAQHLHFFGDDGQNVDAYEIDESFWVDNNPFTLWQPPPAAQKVGRVEWFEYTLLEDEGLDRLIAEGRAVEVDGARGAINAGKAWCHRCGTTEDVDEDVDRWIGNVTVLCGRCERYESHRQPTPAPA